MRPSRQPSSREPSSREPRWQAAWRKLLAADAELDFGLYRRLNARQPEVDEFLASGVAAIIDAALKPADRAPVYDRFRQLAERIELLADSPDAHVQPTAPLPCYAFRLGSGRRVEFRLQHDENRPLPMASPGKRFLLAAVDPVDADDHGLRITLEYCVLEPRRRQAELNAEICRAILASPACADWQEDLSRAQLARHLSRYTGWIARDLFVPRNFDAALQVTLDSLLGEWWQEALECSDEKLLGIRRRQVAVMQKLGKLAIEFLVERWQVWAELVHRPRRVVATNYLCTLDRVPEFLHDDITANVDQAAEWRQWNVLGEDELPTRDFLRRHPHLSIDTGYFSDGCRDRLIASFAVLDQQTDGLLIHGENSAGLRLLEPLYAGQVRLAFIDPPYNTGEGAWSYRDRLGHEHWLAMMRDRVELARRLLAPDGALAVVLDDNEQARLKLLLESVFGEANFLATIVWEKVHTRKNSARHFSIAHDYIHLAARDIDQWQRQLLPREQTIAYRNPDGDPRGPWKSDPVYANKPYAARYRITKPNGVVLDPPPGRYWRYSERNLLAMAERDELVWGEGDGYPLVKRFLSNAADGLVPETLFTREFAGDNGRARAELRDLFGPDRPVSYPKPSRLTMRLAQIGTAAGSDDIVLDFFAGSGSTAHGVIALNRADGGRRKFILVEQAEYFETVLKPRVARLAFAAEWKAGRPLPGTGRSQLVKYLRLESLEQAICQSCRGEGEERAYAHSGSLRSPPLPEGEGLRATTASRSRRPRKSR